MSKYSIVDGNGNLVSISNSIGGAKRSAISWSKKDTTTPFFVLNPQDRTEAKYRNGRSEWGRIKSSQRDPRQANRKGKRYEGVPNLDAMTEDALMKFWLRYQNNQTRDDAAALIGDRRSGYTNIAARLGAYAANKATAMASRKRGDIQAALVYERIADDIYNRLPEDLKW